MMPITLAATPNSFRFWIKTPGRTELNAPFMSIARARVGPPSPKPLIILLVIVEALALLNIYIYIQEVVAESHWK